MKKFIVVLFILAVVSPVFAQQKDDDKSFYYINVTVEKIYPSNQGYIIKYRSSTTDISTVGIPNDWFYEAGGTAQLVKLPLASDWPTMSVFYSEGKFSHVRLYIHPVKSHITWGYVQQGLDVSGFFKDKESFKLQF